MELDIHGCPQLVAAFEKELPGSSQSHPLFNSLQSLKLSSMPLYLLPELQKLALHSCRNLERLDVGSGTGGVTYLPLIRLEIKWCPKLGGYFYLAHDYYSTWTEGGRKIAIYNTTLSISKVPLTVKQEDKAYSKDIYHLFVL
ncbi:hypothetical protein RIF29_00294 [Crotalaria pallida]|uniref:Uncharacterized protein n=1 Tax=Crotalaria pallida TaxID=3830 RepID=A0AAN9IWH8_CROPI